jgi:pimeloyl-ACP methyl ester carboxylesterase
MLSLKVPYVQDVAPEVAGERALLLMLPGAKNTPQQLVEHGFIRALRERRLPVDVLALDAPVDLYLERADIEQVLLHTLDEVSARGYRRIWLFGISLGGSGAMIAATRRRLAVAGVFLLAPFLGTRGIIAEVEAAGGLSHWNPGEVSERDYERALLDDLRNGLGTESGLPPIYLGYGSEDRYRGASLMLAAKLPGQQVVECSGGHDWVTWLRLWQALLERAAAGDWPFADSTAGAGTCEVLC